MVAYIHKRVRYLKEEDSGPLRIAAEDTMPATEKQDQTKEKNKQRNGKWWTERKANEK